MSINLDGFQDLLGTYVRPQRLRVVALAALLLSSIGLQLLNPQILRSLIDTATSGGALETLTLAAVLYIVVALIQQGVAVAATYVGETVGWSATNALRADLAAHCLRLRLSYHNTHTPGEMIERIDGDVTALSNFFSQFVILILGNALLLAGVLVLLYREDYRVGLVLTLYAAGALFLLGRMRNYAVPAVTAERQASAEFFGFLEDRLSGLDDIRANGGGGFVMLRFYQNARHLYETRVRAWMRNNAIWMSVMSIFALGYTLGLGLGGWLFLQGAVSIGTVYLVFQYTNMLRRPLEQISQQLKEFQKAAASIGRVGQLKAVSDIVPEGRSRLAFSGPLLVEFENVAFSYGEENVLDRIGFRLEPRQVLGVLGHTGSGKSTLTRLLFRLYDVTGGSIRLNGLDVRSLELGELRTRVGIVTQEVQLFQASIRDNLTLFDPSVSDKRILQVLDTLGLHEWYDKLPFGLGTELGPGKFGLSAGEAQLLAFARVFLREPGLVILDEASSRLDPLTERLIERAVDRLLHHRTGIIIAHRMGTVQRADQILILEHGRILEQGARLKLLHDPDSRFAQLLRTGMEQVLV